jgi:hypothetical protein
MVQLDWPGDDRTTIGRAAILSRLSGSMSYFSIAGLIASSASDARADVAPRLADPGDLPLAELHLFRYATRPDTT